MNHTNFHMVCAQALQLILESLPHLFDFPGALVLAVLPNGAQVGLEYKFLPPSLEGRPQVGAKVRIRGIQVYAVDPRRLHPVYKLPHRLPGLSHKALAAHANLADQKAGPAQRPIFHSTVPLTGK